MKYIYSVIISICFIAFFFDYEVIAKKIDLNQEIQEKFSSDSNNYEIDVVDSGKLTVEIKSTKSLKVLVYDEKGKKVIGNDTLSGDSEAEMIYLQSAFVSSGKYYIEIYQTNYRSGNFKLKVTMTSSKTDDINTNSSMELAQALTRGKKLTGMMTYRDTEDWYRVDMEGSGLLHLKINSSTDVGVLIYNEKKQELINRKELHGTSSKTASYIFDEFVEKGTYYVRVLKNDDATGLYTITPTVEIIRNTEASDNNAKEWAQPLTRATKYFGTVTLTDENDWYKYEVTKKGKLTWTVDNDVKLTATGYEGANIISSSQVFGTSGYSKVQYVEPGTYYLHLAKTDNQVGRYTVKVDFSSIKDDELSANNNMQSAQFLSVPINPFRGSVTVQDSEDWFVFTLNKKQTINLRLLGNVYMGMSLYRSDKSAVFNILYVNDPVKNNSVAEYVGTLSKGTYYIQTKKMYELTGTYTLALNAGTKPTLSSVTTPKAGAKKVTGKATKGSIVTVKVGRKSYKATANTSGKFTVTVPKLKKGAKLIVTAKNNFGTSAKKTVTVKK